MIESYVALGGILLLFAILVVRWADFRYQQARRQQRLEDLKSWNEILERR